MTMRGSRDNRDLQLASGYNEDYHIFQTTKEEDVMRGDPNGLQGAGIPVENSKGEASAGQEEINVRYAEARDDGRPAAIIKNGCKEIAWQRGKAITFLAKWNYSARGSRRTFTSPLWSKDGETPLFFDKNGQYGMSELMRHYCGRSARPCERGNLFPGALYQLLQALHGRHLRSTKAIWSKDNARPAIASAVRGSKAIRIECRVGGSDLNPYLAFAALIAAGFPASRTR